jgi:hypothetical protein
MIPDPMDVHKLDRRDACDGEAIGKLEEKQFSKRSCAGKNIAGTKRGNVHLASITAFTGCICMLLERTKSTSQMAIVKSSFPWSSLL